MMRENFDCSHSWQVSAHCCNKLSSKAKYTWTPSCHPYSRVVDVMQGAKHRLAQGTGTKGQWMLVEVSQTSVLEDDSIGSEHWVNDELKDSFNS